MITTDLLNRELSGLIRLYDDDVINDAIELAKRVLDPVKSELDGATHIFSKELFVATTLYVIYSESNPTLQLVLDCIVDPKWETERNMLEGISNFRNTKMRLASILVWFKKFDHKYSSLSVGTAYRLVMRCHVQWCKAFKLPFLETSNNVSKPSKELAISDNPNDQSLDSIRIGTRYELADASSFSTKILSSVKREIDVTLYIYTHELLTVVALLTAHTVRFANTGNILEFLADPNWDTHRQIYSHIGHSRELDNSKQIKTKSWVADWVERMLAITYGISLSLSQRSLELLQNRCLAKSPTDQGKADLAGNPAITVNSIQVFKMADVAKSMTIMCDLKDEKKGSGERLLKSAQENNGYRQIPDIHRAKKILEKAKCQFENLIEPINHLQNNLVLSAAMKPANFRIEPILLLGDPGIGKTFLAMELASGLGGSTEKMSAGGAQGGFQLTGSHSSWNSARYGQVFKVLAEGKTSSPVFVIDEVDKIGADDRYPVLPVLLDLFEPNTARQFKDEFFELDFDASRIIYILTANSIENVPEPLLSRVEVFDVPRPEPEQRLRIIHGVAKNLRELTGRKIKLDRSTSEQLADRIDVDLRKTTRIVRDAFSKAILDNLSSVKLIIPDDGSLPSKRNKAPYQVSEIGFF
jgi:ATP-dependent Lon protease